MQRRSALDFAGTYVSASRAYVDAVTILRAHLVPGCIGSDARPTAKPHGGLRASGGCPLVLPPHERLVPVEDDKGAHADAAVRLPFPQRSITEAAEADMRAAVAHAVSHRHHLSEFRSAQMDIAHKVAHMLEPINEWLVATVAGSRHAHLLQGVNVAFIAAWCDARQWPDVAFVERFLRGFPIVGDIPDSGIFRPQDTPPTAPASTMLPASNRKWFDEVVRSVAGAAHRPSTDDHKVLRAVYAQTRSEASKGYIKGPYNSRNQLDSEFGKDMYRIMIRFGIEQGPPGKRKVRAIDNARKSKHNAVSHTHETIVCITFEVAATVSALVLEECIRLGIEMLEMAIGFEDLTAAYRFVANSQPNFTVFCVWRFSDGKSQAGPAFYYVPGHNFGMVSSVLNFNRYPKLMVAMARSLLALPVSQYFDDYFLMDLRSAGASGQLGLQQLHIITNRPLDNGKRQSMASKRVGLGVVIDVSRVHSEWAVVVSTKWHRCYSILTMLREARDSNHLPPGVASTIYGKLGFVLTAVYGRVGRAAAQPLMERVWHDNTTDFTPALAHMLEFYEALLPNLPPLTIPIYDDGQPPVVIYTDASFHRESDYTPVSHMGYQIIDPGDHTRNILPAILHRDRALTTEELMSFSHHKKTLIMQAEIAAAGWAYFSNVERLRGRRVIHFIDNTGALSAMLYGYARKIDCARMVNSFHLLLASLQLRVYFEWVPSEANTSDLPSRAMEAGAMETYFQYFPTSVQGPSHMPPLDAWMPDGAASLESVFAMYGAWVSSRDESDE